MSAAGRDLCMPLFVLSAFLCILWFNISVFSVVLPVDFLLVICCSPISPSLKNLCILQQTLGDEKKDQKDQKHL